MITDQVVGMEASIARKLWSRTYVNRRLGARDGMGRHYAEVSQPQRPYGRPCESGCIVLYIGGRQTEFAAEHVAALVGQNQFAQNARVRAITIHFRIWQHQEVSRKPILLSEETR